MFFSVDDNAPPELLNPPNESNYPPHGDPPPGGPPHDFGFYFYLVVNNLIQIATIVLNFFVSWLVLSHRKKSLGTSFYIMAALLMTILCIEGTVNEVNYALIAGFHIHNAGILWITTIINIYTSYCSVILIWLLGLNRMTIFVMPQLNEFLFTKVKLIMFLIILVVVMIFITHVIGITVDNGQISASNEKLLSIINLISYCIPFSSCLFYVRLYWHLRKTRQFSGIAVYDTMNKAEINTAAQGVVIVLTYLSSMFVHIVMKYLYSKEEAMYLKGLKDLIEALPQRVIPLSTIAYSKQIQRLARSALCMSRRISMSSSIGGKMTSRK